METNASFTVPVRWADLDPNGHVRHSVFLDLGAQARVGFLEGAGFGLAEMAAARIGPVLFTETAQYRHEIRSSELVTVDVELTGISANLKHFAMRHRLIREDGEIACIIDCRGAWMDLDTRRVVPAPDALFAVLERMPRAADYAELASPSL